MFEAVVNVVVVVIVNLSSGCGRDEKTQCETTQNRGETGCHRLKIVETHDVIGGFQGFFENKVKAIGTFHDTQFQEVR